MTRDPTLKSPWRASGGPETASRLSLELATLDDRLAAAARKEGFVLVDLPRAEQA